MTDASPPREPLQPPAATAAEFHRVLGAEAVSNFGAMLSRLALPWIATLALGATPMQMAALILADVIAGALGALLGGGFVDARPKRAVMRAMDVLRAAVLALLAGLAASGLLTMALLFAAAALNGAATIVFEMARSAWIAQRVAAADLARRNAQLSAAGSLAETAAFALGGWIYQGLGAVLALGVDALSCLVSALALRGVREAPPAAAAPAGATATGWLHDTRAGLRMIAGSRPLAALGAIEALVAGAGSLTGTAYMIFVSRDIALAPGPLGMIFATGALGALAGAAAAPALGRRLGHGRALAAGLLLAAIGAACVPLVGAAGLAAVVLLVAQQVVGDAGQTLHAVHDRTLRQTLVPAAQLALIDGSLRAIGQAATIAGALAGGWLGDRTDARTVLALAPLLLLAAAGWAAARIDAPGRAAR